MPRARWPIGAPERSLERMILRTVALVVGALAALLLLVAGPGTRLGLWDFRFGFQLLQWGAYAGIAAIVLAIVVLAVPRLRAAGVVVPLAALVLGLVAFGVPWSILRAARGFPPIHDITTDPDDPPAFVAVLPRRAGAPNSAEYERDSTAAQQRAAFPHITPATFPAAPAATFARALDAARAMGWEIVAADSAAGRIEATATTAWFGFKDDVVIRIRPDGTGSRVDVRSTSRVGKGDVGANAKRIRAYLARLRG